MKTKTIEERIRESLRVFGEDFYNAVDHETEDAENESLDVATKAIMEIVEEEKKKWFEEYENLENSYFDVVDELRKIQTPKPL